MIRLIQRSGRNDETASVPRQGHEADDGHRDAEEDEDVEEVVREPGDPQLDERGRPDRQMAGQGRRVVPGEDVEAGQVQGIRDGLSGQRTAEDDQVPVRPRREHREGDDGNDPDHPQAVAGGPCDREPDQARPDQRQPDGLVAGQRPEPEQHAQRKQPRIRQRRAARVTDQPRHEQARRRARSPRTASSSRAATN